MENEFRKAFPESYPMKGGDGPHSYAQNSTLQRLAIETAKNIVQGAIASKFDSKTICPSSTNPICIADFGCSTGPNTFIAVQYIIEAIELQYQSQNEATPEFQVFFNDQVSNDFNTLFQNLPPNRNYFAAGVPGSFFGRLFPRQSLHLVHSSASLNWMSKLPKEITDRSFGAWNKGRIHYANAPREVVAAYESQHKKDLRAFLHARAQELVGNGIMVLQISAAHDVIDFSQDSYARKDFDLLASCLVDMAKLRLVSEEKVDTFNLPLFFPHLKDLKEILESNEDFSIEQMDILNPKSLFEPNVEMYVSHCRAALGGLIEKHFGDGVVDELFDHFTKKVMEFPEIMNPKNLKLFGLLVLLKRKVHA